MKRLMKTLLMICGIVFAAMSLVADTETVDGITWNYTVSGGSATIWAPIYPPADVVAGGDFLVGYHSAISTTTTGAIEIPSSLGGFPVTTIGRCAFSGCSSLTSISIPAFVGSIGDRAFSGCSSLTSITMQGNAPSVDGSAFSGIAGGCIVRLPSNARGYMIANGKWQGMTVEYYSMEGVPPIFRIEGGVLIEVLLNGATEIVIPNTVTCFAIEAFYACSGLTSVTIPDSVTRIDPWTFTYCSGLISFSVDAGNANYSSVNGLLLSKDGTTLIRGVNGDVTIPDSVTSIGDEAFYYCSGLISFSVDAGNANYSSVNGLLLSKDGTTLIRGVNGDVTIPDSVTSIRGSAFARCSGLTNVVIGSGVTNIGSGAFASCTNLTSVTIPNSVANIGEWAFSGCRGLTNVAIGSGVTNIGSCAFASCANLTSVTIPDGVTSIGHYAFSDCSGLTNVVIGSGVTNIGSGAFASCTNLTSVIFLDNAPTVDYSFDGVNSSCMAYVSPKSTGWSIGVGEKWNGLTLQYWLEILKEVASDAEVGGVVATFADKDVAAHVSTKGKYDAFKKWVNDNNLYQPNVVASTNAAVSYLLGAEKLFVNAPEIEFGECDVSSDTGEVTVSIMVKDGEDAVAVASEKVKEMFEATSDLSDWNGTGKKLTPTVTDLTQGQANNLNFKVRPGDGTSPSAFLRIRK